ncbi:MAG: sensor histidine kinase [Clostridiales Family XIII bacterium]|jgi:signal transduction histidine kinase|nr:sensor histidine kinase [Clostridiales Family XIII bacterium]
MSRAHFWRDKLFFIAAVSLAALFSGAALWALGVPPLFIFLAGLLYLGGAATALLREFALKSSYYKTLCSLLDSLDKKRYIADVAPTPSFWEGEVTAEVLRAAGKSMNDELAAERKNNLGYREYVELWVHEIKTPISGAMLICENNGYEDVAAELAKIEGYVEQALFYARSGAVEKDYILRETDLRKLVAGLIRGNARMLIARKIKVEPLAEGVVVTDSKWLTFILRQLLDNAVKYGAKTVTFTFADGVLTVSDDGVGIPAGDLPRVFERGFTGENGRTTSKSTGMGLYICKELCRKMGLGISARSENGTAVSITFPQNPYGDF